MSYSRSFYVFSSILYLNKRIIARYMILDLLCITGEAGGFRNHFRAEKKKENKTGSNVTTFQCRDVATSRRLVNKRKSQRVISQRHRDFCLRIIKSKRDLIWRHRRTCGLEHGKQSNNDSNHWKRQCFCIFFIFS